MSTLPPEQLAVSEERPKADIAQTVALWGGFAAGSLSFPLLFSNPAHYMFADRLCFIGMGISSLILPIGLAAFAKKRWLLLPILPNLVFIALYASVMLIRSAIPMHFNGVNTGQQMNYSETIAMIVFNLTIPIPLLVALPIALIRFIFAKILSIRKQSSGIG
jgi:hypothetical protein